MVIGTPEALRSLAVELQATATESSGELWPNIVTSVRVEGPYSGTSDYKLSFHVEPAAGIPPSLRLLNSGPSLRVVVPVLVLAVIGAVSIVRWLVAHGF
jgi:hypothetical protein